MNVIFLIQNILVFWMFTPLMPDLNTHSDVQRSRYIYGMFAITIQCICKTYSTKGLADKTTDKTQLYSLHNVVVYNYLIYFLNSLVYKLHYGTRASSNFLCRPHKMWLTYLLFIWTPSKSRYLCCQLWELQAYSFQLFLMCGLKVGRKTVFHLAWPVIRQAWNVLLVHKNLA